MFKNGINARLYLFWYNLNLTKNRFRMYFHQYMVLIARYTLGCKLNSKEFKDRWGIRTFMIRAFLAVYILDYVIDPILETFPDLW